MAVAPKGSLAPAVTPTKTPYRAIGVCVEGEGGGGGGGKGVSYYLSGNVVFDRWNLQKQLTY